MEWQKLGVGYKNPTFGIVICLNRCLFIRSITADGSEQAKNDIEPKIGATITRHVKSFFSEKQLEDI